jgi:hypothetical protein
MMSEVIDPPVSPLKRWQRAQGSRLLLELMSFFLNLLLTWLTARRSSSQAPADRSALQGLDNSRYSDEQKKEMRNMATLCSEVHFLFLRRMSVVSVVSVVEAVSPSF